MLNNIDTIFTIFLSFFKFYQTRNKCYVKSTITKTIIIIFLYIYQKVKCLIHPIYLFIIEYCQIFYIYK